MEPNGHATNSFYNYLIRPDKSATRQLEDLCLGLAKLIVSLVYWVHRWTAVTNFST
jgi:hypothetical protein